METEQTKPANDHLEKNPETKPEDGVSPVSSPNDALGKGAPIPNPEENESSSPSDSQDPTTQMKSPPIQTMGPPPGYDPNRIPSSIFSTKPTNPTEWSVASNESLFSIHMGNNSFSRDYAILFGKSGDGQDLQGSELPRLDEWNNNNNNNNNNNLNQKSSELISLPPVMESPLHDENNNVEQSSIEKADSAEKVEKKQEKESEVVVNDVRNAAPDETTLASPLEKHEKDQNPGPAEAVNVNSGGANRPDVKKAMPAERTPSNPQTFPSPPRFSDDSGHSGSSFAFPVLLGEGGKPESLKVVPEKPEPPTSSQAQDSDETPNNASETRWCSSLLCWPRCC